MPLLSSAQATRATRVRVTYQINAATLESARAMAQRITERWQAQSNAYVVLPASDPVQGGGMTIAGFGGTHYFTSIDVKTSYALASMTWGEWLTPLRSFSTIGTLGLSLDYSTAEYDHADVVPEGHTASTIASPAAQAGVARDTASTDANEHPNGLQQALSGFKWLVVLVVALSIGYIVFAFRGVRK